MATTITHDQITYAKIWEYTSGIWRAQLHVTVDAAFTGEVTFTIEGENWRGTVRPDTLQFVDGLLKVQLVGGLSSLVDTLPVRHYTGTTAGQILKDLTLDAGRELDDSVSSDVSNFVLAHWHRFAGDFAEAMDLLAEKTGFAWRVLRNGKVWMGSESWPELEAFEFVELDRAPEERGFIVSPKSAPLLKPGVTLLGERIRTVITELNSNSLTQAAKATDDLATVRKTAKGALGRQLDYRALYTATVVKDHGDDYVDVRPDDERVRGNGLSRVRVRYGAPGLHAVSLKGTNVLLGFENGDPTRPFCTAWSTDHAAVLRLLASSRIELGGNTDAVALASLVLERLTQLYNAISTAPVTPLDGGAAFKAAIIATLGTYAWPQGVASTKVKAV